MPYPKVELMSWKTEPMIHQVEAFDKLKDEEFDAYLMEPGTGKSKCAIDKAVYLFLAGKIDFVMVVAPNGVHEQWAEEQIPEHCGIPFESLVWSGNTTQKEQKEFDLFMRPSSKLKFFCINVEAFSLSIEKHEFFSSKPKMTFFRSILKRFKSYVVLDEASRLKSVDSNRTLNLTYGINEIRYKEVVRRSMNEETVIDAVIPTTRYRSILTGSIVTNSPYDLFAPFNFGKYDFFGVHFFGFRSHYGIEKFEKSFGNKGAFVPIHKKDLALIKAGIIKGWTNEEISMSYHISESSCEYIRMNPDISSPYKNLDELKLKIAPVSYIKNLQDCIDIADPVRETALIEMSKEQWRIYNEVKRDLLSEYGNKSLTVKSKLALIVRLSQITSGFFPSTETLDEDSGEFIREPKLTLIGGQTPVKISAILEELTEYNFDKPLIIFARFTSDIELCYDILTKKRPDLVAKKYYGATSNEDRSQIKIDFREGLIDILVANESVAGIGLNLQRSNKTFWISQDYSYERRKQGEGRTWRTGQDLTQPVLFKDFVCRGTIDERVLEVLNGKRELAEYFQDHTIAEFLGGTF